MRKGSYALLRLSYGLQLVQVVDPDADAKVRIRVRKWKAASKAWTSAVRVQEADVFDPTTAPMETEGVIAARAKFNKLKMQAGAPPDLICCGRRIRPEDQEKHRRSALHRRSTALLTGGAR